MTTLPVFGLLLAVADAATHWPPFRWAGYALSVVVQALAAAAWWKVKHIASSRHVRLPQPLRLSE